MERLQIRILAIIYYRNDFREKNPNSTSTAVRIMICVITQTSMAPIITDTEIPVYQQSFPKNP